MIERKNLKFIIAARRGLAASALSVGSLSFSACSKPKQELPAAVDLKPVAQVNSNALEKECCFGQNDCKGQGGCAVPENHDCAGKNDCKGKGGCNMHCPQ